MSNGNDFDALSPRPRCATYNPMKSTYTVTHAQSLLPRLLREASDSGPIAITRHDETVAYLVSRERMEAIAETLEILANPEAIRAIREYESGKTRFRVLRELANGR